MELSTVAASFDRQPVYDAYTEVFLCFGQPDLYDASVRDSGTGWRRSISSASLELPARGVLMLCDEPFLTGRVVHDYFGGSIIRSHLLLHPSDGLFSTASAATFLSAATPTSFYGSKAWRKELKEESESSQYFNLYDVYLAPTESVSRDWIVKDPDDTYYRVQNIEKMTGELNTLVCTELGSAAFCSVSYIARETYDATTDSSGAADPISITAFLERYQTNYRYMNRAAAKYEKGDKVLTVLVSDVATPQEEDTVELGTETYRVLELQPDGSDCWELHLRPV